MRDVDYQPGRIVEMLGVAALLTLAFSGYVKGSSLFAWLPASLTLIAAGCLALLTAHSLLSVRRGIPHSPLLIVLWASCLSGLLATGAPMNEYAAVKPVAVFLIAPLCFIGGAMLLRTSKARNYFLVGVALIGVVVIALGFLDPGAAGSTDRLVSEGTSTINTGRAAGAAAVVFALAGLSGRRRVWLLVLAAACAWGALSIASRGPVLAAGVAIMVTVAFSRTSGRFLRVLTVAVGGIALVQWALASGAINARLTSVDDTSAETRRLLWADTYDLMLGHPLGIGWGRLYEHVGSVANSEGWIQYPHNVFFEVTSEGGWLAGLLLAGVVVIAVRRQSSLMHGRPVEMAMFALLLFALVNASVSGDVNSNRGLWVAIGAAFAAGPGLSVIQLRGRSARNANVLQRKDHVVQSRLEGVDVRGR